jgi:pimeloyl-ACP methyl ester carboxylesterase
MLQFLDVGSGGDARRLAVLSRNGSGPSVIWLGGFASDMRGTKAEALDDWAVRRGRAYVRFDYTGHGESSGRFEEGTISRWLAEALAVVERFASGRPILVGSSMGGWLALLATRALIQSSSDRAPAGLVLIAPAVDFTERLMWDVFPESVRDEIRDRGVFHQPSPYGSEPYPVTRALIEDGRRHLLLGAPIEARCPVHILQGMQDADVPWRHALGLVECLPGDCVSLTLVKDGDHRLSRPTDLERLVAAIEAIA